MTLGYDAKTGQWRIPRGAPYRCVFRIRAGDGFADLSGRDIRLLAWKGDDLLAEAVASIDPAAPDSAVMALTGSHSDAMAGLSNVHMEIASIVTAGKVQLLTGAVLIGQAAPTPGADGSGDADAQELILDETTQELVATVIGAPGRPPTAQEIATAVTAQIGDAVAPLVAEQLPAAVAAQLPAVAGDALSAIEAEIDAIRVAAGIVGGIAIGSAGAPGTLFEGYTLSAGDDFLTLDLLGPANPRGRWFATRTYGPGARGSDTMLRYVYDVDPLHTGHNDSNRGEAVGYGNLRLERSVAVLQHRLGTAAERRHMQNINRRMASAMLSSAGAFAFYPADAGSGDILVEWRAKFSPKAGNPAGWHPTLWTQSLAPTATFSSDEHDIEGNSQGLYLHQNVWGPTGERVGGTNVPGLIDVFDGAWHDIVLKLNTTRVEVWVDGELAKTGTYNANTVGEPQYAMITNHSYFGAVFEGESFDMNAWMASVAGATVSIDYVRCWRRSARRHFRPLVAIDDVQADYGEAVTIDLPSAAAIWGDASVTEYLQAIPHEEFEPGGDHVVGYNQFPAGVSYDAETRTLTVAPTSERTGRLNFALHGWLPDGSTMEPARFAVCFGPKINVQDLAIARGLPFRFDLYAACDCGVLVSDAAGHRAKVVTIAGLPAGLAYDDATGLITGIAVDAGVYPLVITCTNSLGQTATAEVDAIVAAPAAAITAPSWTGWSDLRGWFDLGDEATVQLGDMDEVLGLANKAGGGDLVGGGYTDCMAYVRGGQANRNLLRLTRNLTVLTPSPRPRLLASASAPVSTMFQGSDQPYTVLVAYTPTGPDTCYIWSASANVSQTASQQIALIRRATTACGIRRAIATAPTNEVTWGAGQAAGTPRIVAVRHTGTACTVWDTSLTKAVDNAANDVGAFGVGLQFHLLAALTNGPDPLTWAATQGSTDLYECVVAAGAKPDEEITAAISDMALRWGIALG